LGVFRAGTVLVARFREPVRLTAATAGGAPLVRYGRLLSAAPLQVDEQAALGAFEDTVVLVAGGLARAVPLNDETRVDISEWIDVSRFDVIKDLRSLGAVQSEPQAAVAELVETVRQSFGMGPLKGDATETLQALLRLGSAHSGLAMAGLAMAGLAGLARVLA